MVFTPYLVCHRHPAISGQVLLFSTRTGAMVLLPEADFAALDRGESENEFAADLTEMGFLCSDPEAEQQEVLRYLEQVNRYNPNLTLAVVLGMECNFRCTYCFEGQQKGSRAMDDRTADQLVAFVRERFVTGKKKLILQLYGGEPLLYTERIIYLAERLKPLAEQRGGELVLDIVTNGSLLNEKTVDALNRWGLDGVKVTLDGPADNHNGQRPFKSGAPSFEVIVDNLQSVCDKTKIRLGGNYTAKNYREFVTVLDLLQARGVTPDKIERVSFNIVMQVSDRISSTGYTGGCATINEPWLRDAALHVRKEVMARGYPVAELGPEPCAVEIDDAYTVHCDGSLYKCITWVGHEQYKIGDLRQGISKEFASSHHLFHWHREERCRSCVYLPLCFGGCRYMAYQRDGHMGRVDCRKPFLQATLQSMLLQDVCYRYGLASAEELE